jgi:hypothetical protein
MRKLKIILMSLVTTVFLGSTAFADLKYNAFTGQWENVGSDYQMKYNTFDNSWGYQKPDATLQYNPFSGRWEYER